jgi:hypothetical protein
VAAEAFAGRAGPERLGIDERVRYSVCVLIVQIDASSVR